MLRAVLVQWMLTTAVALGITATAATLEPVDWDFSEGHARMCAD